MTQTVLNKDDVLDRIRYARSSVTLKDDGWTRGYLSACENIEFEVAELQAPVDLQAKYAERGDVIRKYQEILADCLSIFTQIDAHGSLVDAIRKALEISAPTRPETKA